MKKKKYVIALNYSLRRYPRQLGGLYTYTIVIFTYLYDVNKEKLIMNLNPSYYCYYYNVALNV